MFIHLVKLHLTPHTEAFYPALDSVIVLYSRGGGQRLVQSEGCGLLGSTRSLLATGDVRRGRGCPGWFMITHRSSMNVSYNSYMSFNSMSICLFRSLIPQIYTDHKKIFVFYHICAPQSFYYLRHRSWPLGGAAAARLIITAKLFYNPFELFFSSSVFIEDKGGKIHLFWNKTFLNLLHLHLLI